MRVGLSRTRITMMRDDIDIEEVSESLGSPMASLVLAACF